VTETVSTIGKRSPSRFLSRVRRSLLRLVGQSGEIPVGSVNWGALRRTQPLSRNFGYDRGKPIDRYYIEAFLSDWSADVAGRVLEVKDATYTREFGASRVSRSDVVDIDPTNPKATIIADLNQASELPADSYDCIILTQTLQFVYALGDAIRYLYRSLKPGGVLLVTVPCITPVRRIHQGWYWSFTEQCLQRLLSEQFAPSDVLVRTYGNLLSATAFLYGLSATELGKSELNSCDPDYQVIIAARAVRPVR